jgi:hypothetical protein
MPSHRVVWALTALALVAVALYAASRLSEPAAEPLRTPEAVGGVVLATPGDVPLPEATAVPTTPPAAAATPTPLATAAPTPAATVAPVATSVAAMPTTPVSPTPSTAVAATDPGEAVLTFYEAVAGEDFDTAYALWDEGMRAMYPREPNLDSRFDDTAAITFSQLSVAEMSGETATVQANFTETYESGASRQFIGYWRLVLVDGQWLLAEPHY